MGTYKQQEDPTIEDTSNELQLSTLLAWAISKRVPRVARKHKDFTHGTCILRQRGERGENRDPRSWAT